MKGYYLSKTKQEKFDFFILCLNTENFSEYLHDIERELASYCNSAKVLIDMVLFTGNLPNRYFSCVFKNGKLHFSTAENVSPSNFYKVLASKILSLNKYKHYLEYSCLTHSQKDEVRAQISL